MSSTVLQGAMPPKAIEVWTRDQEIDQLCTSLSQELLVCMMEKPDGASLGTHLMFCTKNIERMGDHVTNIAEALHYMVNGETLSREHFTSMLTVDGGT
jgi:phosphate transport system protein